MLTDDQVDALLSILRQDDDVARLTQSYLQHAADLRFVVDQEKRAVVHFSGTLPRVGEPKGASELSTGNSTALGMNNLSQGSVTAQVRQLRALQHTTADVGYLG
jgi:hypothetical protein